MLQYLSILFYLCAYVTFAQDIRTSGIVWTDYDFMETRWKEKLINKRIVMREQSMRSSNLGSKELEPDSTANQGSALSRACGPTLPALFTTPEPEVFNDREVHLGHSELASIQVEVPRGSSCAAPRECGSDGGCAVQ